MTNAELARDKLKYWKLISRAKKVNFKIPSHWLKYGFPPTNVSEILNVNIEAISDKLLKFFDNDDWFYNQIKSK